MKLANAVIDVPSRTTMVRIVFLGDIHLGAASCDEELLESVAASLSGEHVYWVDLGDAIDAINLGDPRFDPRELPSWITIGDLADLPSAQIQRYAHYFKPHADRCLARLEGNHEDTLRRKYERDVYREINEAIGLPQDRALGYSGFLRIRIQRVSGESRPDSWTLVAYLHHGAGGGQLAGAKALRLERLPMAFDADIYAVGHTHTKIVLHKKRLGLYPRSDRIQSKPLVMLNTGSFLKRSGYATRRGLYPQAMGPVELWLYPDKRQIKVVT